MTMKNARILQRWFLGITQGGHAAHVVWSCAGLCAVLVCPSLSPLPGEMCSNLPTAFRLCCHLPRPHTIKVFPQPPPNCEQILGYASSHHNSIKFQSLLKKKTLAQREAYISTQTYLLMDITNCTVPLVDEYGNIFGPLRHKAITIVI